MHMIRKLWVGVAFAVLVVFVGRESASGQPSEGWLSGEMTKWQRVTLSFRGPRATQHDSDPNPFLDHRLDAVLRSPSGKEHRVPGFFDGDGRGHAAGNVWRVHFTPEEAGRWTYEISFRSGKGVAVAEDPDAGTRRGPPDGAEGSFEVDERDPAAPGFLRWGLLEHVGRHYLKFRDGPYWIKAGTDSPENLLAYEGLDQGGHTYGPHVRDWGPDDPDWNGGEGRGIVGALNYLASRKVNSVYFLPMNIGGDGKDTWPFAGPIDPEGSPANDNLHYDLCRLHRWDAVFTHAQRVGIVLHFVLNEAEEANKRELDDAQLGTERKLFHRELVARFAYHNALVWNLSEEYDLALDLGPERVKRFAEHLQGLDPYDHPITVHNQKPPLESWAPFFGDPRFSVTSIQYHPGDLSYGDLVERFRERSREAGRPVAVCVDEFDRAATVDDETRGRSWPFLSGHSRLRKGVLWPIYLSGGQVEYILETMLETEDFRPYETLWRYTWNARKLLEENLPFWDMDPADGLLSGEAEAYGGGQVLALRGDVYAIYLPEGEGGGELDLQDAPGIFIQRWYDPREGAFRGDAREVEGGGVLELGDPPASPAEDWVVLLTRRGWELPEEARR